MDRCFGAQFIMADQDSDPKHHTQKMQRRFQELIQHLRSDIEKWTNRS